MGRGAYGRRSDVGVAALLTAILGLSWTLHAWSDLAAFRLPDTDDVVRLQQWRDWLDGGAFADLTQRRIGAGTPMHWSRLPDLAPVALIWLLTPLAGRGTGELAAVILWPLALFWVALLLTTRIARVVSGNANARPAMIVAALAYPATTVFMPGRIDHHGLQVVFLLGAALAAVGEPTARKGLATGLLAAGSLVVGLETAPLFLALGALAVVEWIGEAPSSSGRLAGVSVGMCVGLIAGRALFATDGWDYPACDGFTRQFWTAALIPSTAVLLLSAAGGRLATAPRRAAAAVTVLVAASAFALLIAPNCLSPYGNLDPLLARLWLAKVGEAQSLLVAPPATAFSYVGLLAAGTAASLWRLHWERSRAWLVLSTLLLCSLVVTSVQLRGAYAGAMLAAPALASVIVAARRRGAGLSIAAWMGSAGVLYPMAAQATAHPGTAPNRRSCSDPPVIARLAELPPGVLLAPIDTGAWALAATRHRVVAAPYHRNQAGMLATLRFHRGSPDQARSIAEAWHVRYVLICAGDAAGLTASPDSFAAALLNGRAPAWLRRLPRERDVHLYKVEL
jgi:hypothetical protein